MNSNKGTTGERDELHKLLQCSWTSSMSYWVNI